MTRRFKRLLVAGGAGFIGSNFVRRLRRERPGTEVWVLDKLTYAGNSANLAEFDGGPGYRFVRGDICDRALARPRHTSTARSWIPSRSCKPMSRAWPCSATPPSGIGTRSFTW